MASTIFSLCVNTVSHNSLIYGLISLVFRHLNLHLVPFVAHQ